MANYAFKDALTGRKNDAENSWPCLDDANSIIGDRTSKRGSAITKKHTNQVMSHPSEESQEDALLSKGVPHSLQHTNSEFPKLSSFQHIKKYNNSSLNTADGSGEKIITTSQSTYKTSSKHSNKQQKFKNVARLPLMSFLKVPISV